MDRNTLNIKLREILKLKLEILFSVENLKNYSTAEQIGKLIEDPYRRIKTENLKKALHTINEVARRNNIEF